MFSSTFSFDSPQRSPSLDSSNTRSTSRSVSPCSDPTSPYPSEQYSITDLAACFQNSKFIRRDAQICYDSCDAYANTLDDDAAWEIPAMESTEPVMESVESRRTSAMTIQRPHSPTSRRAQRQVSARMMCSSVSHHRDIAALVGRMVERKEQCSVSTSPIESIEQSGMGVAAEDDGSDSGEMSLRRVVSSSEALRRERVDFRRMSEMKATGACVSKAMRFRRETRSKR